MRINDTIAAVSTPRGKGGIAVIRISGADAIGLADRAFKPARNVSLAETASGRAVYGRIFSPDEKKPIDDGIAVVFRAPSSFTGEDTVEISCHGGLLVTEAVLSAVLTAGARHAEAGEFTRRAFVNGKMGLSEAEALSNLLEAKNAAQLRLARSGLDGRLEKKCRALYDGLKMLLASLYARIDYPDEDLADMSADEMCVQLKDWLGELERLIATYKSGHAIAEGIRTVICGKPNVGKSSLYNRIVGREAAIVTDLEGTTRDVLEETASLGGVTLRLCDTAGLRDTGDRVESIGVSRAYEKINEAELILAVFDGSSPLSEEDIELMEYLSDKKDRTFAVINKTELDQKIEKDRIISCFGEVIEISAASEDGIKALIDTAESEFLDRGLNVDNDPIVFGARQHASLSKARICLDEAVAILENGGEIDASAFAVETAMASLAELDGREVGEDIVSRIFSSFCVGK